jgi:hypothetical protein
MPAAPSTSAAAIPRCGNASACFALAAGAGNLAAEQQALITHAAKGVQQQIDAFSRAMRGGNGDKFAEQIAGVSG